MGACGPLHSCGSLTAGWSGSLPRFSCHFPVPVFHPGSGRQVTHLGSHQVWSMIPGLTHRLVGAPQLLTVGFKSGAGAWGRARSGAPGGLHCVAGAPIQVLLWAALTVGSLQGDSGGTGIHPRICRRSAGWPWVSPYPSLGLGMQPCEVGP